MNRNEFGIELDKNGYAPSILKRHEGCHICGRRDLALQRHEVFHGSNRQKSKEYGLWIEVCWNCHNVIHNGNGELDKCLKKEGEQAALIQYRWSLEDFRSRFGKSYL